jgi:hypothetical protein
MKTMHEYYGDGSPHIVCEECGLCMDCGDCKCPRVDFANLDLTLSITKKEWLILAKNTLRRKLDPASASLAEEATTLRQLKKVLWKVLRNEIIIDAVKYLVAEGEARAKQSDQAAPSGEVKESKKISLGKGSKQGTDDPGPSY